MLHTFTERLHAFPTSQCMIFIYSAYAEPNGIAWLEYPI